MPWLRRRVLGTAGRLSFWHGTEAFAAGGIESSVFLTCYLIIGARAALNRPLVDSPLVFGPIDTALGAMKRA